MLLTSSQISMGISSAIVFIFSTILFLSGYILQQRTIHDIEAIIIPPPAPVTSSTPLIPIERAPETVQWHKVAYVQAIQSHNSVCASAIIFAELARQESRAHRVLLYPRSWDDHNDGPGETAVPGAKQRQRSMRFLRKIAARYKISLRPMDGNAESVLPLNRLYSLIDFQTIFHLNAPGIITNATALDELFTLEPTNAGLHFLSPDATIPNDQQATEEEPLALILSPSMTTYQSLLKTISPLLTLNDITRATESSAKFAAGLFSQTSSLHQYDVDSYADGLPACIHFSDPGIPGPDYDIPSDIWRRARPKTAAAARVWEGVYAEYRALRMAVCGLEVENMPKDTEIGEDEKIGL